MLKKLLISALVVLGTIRAQVPVKLTDGTGTERIVAASGKEYDSTMTNVPTEATVVTATTTKVQLIWCSTTTSSAVTLTLTDNQASPKPYGTAVSIAGNSIVVIHNSLVGIPMQGIKWTASAATLYCQVVGVQ